METDTIHPAEAYLRNENNPSSLYVKIEGVGFPENRTD